MLFEGTPYEGPSISNIIANSDDQRIKVICRVRFSENNSTGTSLSYAQRKCITLQNPQNLCVTSRLEQKSNFNLDYVAGEEVSQEEIFQVVGLPYVKTCLEGYNGTILCYGQTGSGKTFTMFGPSSDTAGNKTELSTSRGLVPRVLECLWSHISRQSRRAEVGLTIIYLCKCTFFEIYQEKVFDLLDAAGVVGSSSLQIREHPKQGIYIEGITEEIVNSAEDATRVLAVGYRNRHVGETSMNLESSRSHAIFQLIISITEERDGLKSNKTARFSLVDLAGSERQKDTHATGERLKEAGQINMSLSTLGNVINALSTRKNGAGAGSHHINYRDSKLTFLLRDSLGGNSKTILVATVSPLESNIGETLSTLNFAQRAKAVRTSAVVNEETSGSLLALQKEVLSLKREILQLRGGGSGGGCTSTTADMMGMGIGLTGSPSIPIRLTSHGSPAITGEMSSLTLTTPAKLSSMSLGVTPSKHRMSITMGNIASGIDFKLLAEALERCRVADEMRIRSELKVRALSARIEQEDKVSMSLKMKIKMQESRLKSKIHEEGEEALKDMIKVEVEAVREELKSEVLRHRQRADELERKLTSSGSTSGNGNGSESDVIPIWNDQKEIHFQHQVAVQIAQVEKSQIELERRLEIINSDRFQQEYGFTAEEAQSLKRRCSEAQKRAEDAEVKCGEMRITRLGEQMVLQEIESRFQDSKREFDRMSSIQALYVNDLENRIENIQKELDDRCDEIRGLKAGIEKTDLHSQDMQRRKDMEAREQFNKVMKDNMLLLKSTRELEGVVDDQTVQLKNIEVKMNEMRELHAIYETTKEAEIMAMAEDCRVLRNEVKEAEMAKHEYYERYTVQHHENIELQSRMDGAEESNRHFEALIQQSTRDLERAKFEVDNAKEDAENMYIQTETLQRLNDELTSALEVSEERTHSLNAKIENMSNELEVMRSEMRSRDSSGDEEMQVLSLLIQQKQQEINRYELIIKELTTDKISLESENSVHTTETIRLHEEVHTLSTEKTHLQSMIHELRDRMKDVDSESQIFKVERSFLHEEVANLRGQIDDQLERLQFVMDEKAIAETMRSRIEEEKGHVCFALEESLGLLSEERGKLMAAAEAMEKVTKERDEAKRLFDELRTAMRQQCDYLQNTNCSELDEKEEEEDTGDDSVGEVGSGSSGGGDSSERVDGMHAMSDEFKILRRQQRAYKRLMEGSLAEKDRSLTTAQQEITHLQRCLHEEIEKSRRNEAISSKLMEELSQSLITVQESKGLVATLASTESELREIKILYDAVKTQLADMQVHTENIELELQEKNTAIEDSEELRNAMESLGESVARLGREKSSLLQRLTEEELRVEDLSRRLNHSVESSSATEKHLQDAREEVARLSGHNNMKQKIHITMQMKKDIQDQLELLKQQQEQIAQMTFERDAARADLRKLKSSLKEVHMSSSVKLGKRNALTDIKNGVSAP